MQETRKQTLQRRLAKLREWITAYFIAFKRAVATNNQVMWTLAARLTRMEELRRKIVEELTTHSYYDHRRTN